MMNMNSILKEYRNGDFETRLSLFLNYRDFRDEFISIEAQKRSWDEIDNDGQCGFCESGKLFVRR